MANDSEVPPSLKETSSGMQGAAGTVGFFVLISRVFGFVRDMLTASYLGVGLYSDAFFVAYRIPNLFRRLFGEGCLTVSFVPIFTKLVLTRGKEAAQLFTKSTFTLLTLLLSLIVLAAILLAEPLTWLFASGFYDEKLIIATKLLRLVLPYILLVSLVALSMGVLNSLKHFSSSAFSQTLLNIAMIGSLLASPLLPWHPAYSLALGVLIGGVLQFGLQVFAMARRDYHLGFTWQRPLQPEVKELGVTMFPSVFGAAAYQINLLVNTQIASHLPQGSVSYLYYADRVTEFPLGIVAVSLGMVILPFLSRQMALDDLEGVKATIREGLKTLYFLMLPATVGIIVLRVPITDLLYHRRAFTETDVYWTAYALMFSAPGLLGVGTLRITLPVFYSMKDMWTPFWVSTASMVINLALGLSLMNTSMRHGGLALAVSISATFNAIVLHWLLRRKIGRINTKLILGDVSKMVLASLAMGLFVWGAYRYFDWAGPTSHGRLYEIITLLATISVAAVMYFYLCHLLKIAEALKMVNYLKRRLRIA